MDKFACLVGSRLAFCDLKSSTSEPVAIVGAALRFPGGISNEIDLWQALVQGRDLVGQIDSARWATEVFEHPKRAEQGRSVTFSAGVLSGIDQFDASFFGISPREACWLDPQQRLLLELAWEAMENGGIPPSSLAGTDCAVYVGISGFDYGMRRLDDLSSVTAHTMTGNTLSIAANRLSYIFDLRGPSMAIDTACSSSLVALHQACNALHAGEASIAMVAGVNLLLHPYPFIGFSNASMLSAGGRCRAFDAAGDGYVRAEGGALLLLKPLRKAIADGDHIEAIIRASGVNADGARKTSLTIPSQQGQVALMRSVLQRSGLQAADIAYVEAHGTGTAVGDPVEALAIGEVYGRCRPAGQPLPIGSIKTNLGHLEPASGMAGLAKALTMLKHRTIPPSLHFGEPNSQICLKELNLDVVTSTRELSRANTEDCPLVIGINSFGFGGANAHVLLQEFKQEPLRSNRNLNKLPPLILSAKTTVALRALAGRYADTLRHQDPSGYYDIAHCAAFRREWLDKRLAVAAEHIDALVDQLDKFALGENEQSEVLEDALSEPGSLAFVYSGNGSQWTGMGQLLLAESPRFKALLTELDEPIHAISGFSIMEELGAEASASRLDDTSVAQPLLFAIQVALTTMLRETGIIPKSVIGHSVGEVAAAWASGALNIEQAIHVICARSTAQGLTRGAGRMAAVTLSEQAIRTLLLEYGLTEIEVAGINSPDNVTISGTLSHLEQLKHLLKPRGVFFRLLDLDYAFHSRSMDRVEQQLLASLAGLVPRPVENCDFVSTVTGDLLDGKLLDAGYWWDNVRQPVRFAQGVANLINCGCRIFVEIGPHAILQRYITECLAIQGKQGRVLPTLQRNNDGFDCLEESALRVHLLTKTVGLGHLFPEPGNHVVLPNYPWQRERHWLPTTAEGYHLIGRNRVHPLLGWRLKEVDAAWENVLDPQTHTWLEGHQVGGVIVLPGAAYVEMALAASHEWYAAESCDLEHLDILAPVVFDGEHGRSLRLELNPLDGGFQIRSRQRLSQDEWMVNAVGRLLGAVAVSRPEAKIGQAGSEGDVIDQKTHYRLAGLLGLDYGREFQGLIQATVLGDSLSAIVALPDGAQLGRHSFFLNPALLDTCFQSLIDFFQNDIEHGRGLPMLPVKVGRLRYFVKEPVARFQTRLLRRSPRSVLAEFDLLSAEGRVVATLSGCRFRAATLRQQRYAEPACWETVTQLCPLPFTQRQISLPPTVELNRQVRAWFVSRESLFERAAYYSEIQPLFDALVIASIYHAFSVLFFEQPVWVQKVLSAPEEGNAELLPFVVWLKKMLQQEGLLREEVRVWRLAESDLPRPDEIWRTLLRDYPSCLPELLLVGRIGSRLASLLSGKEDLRLLVEDAVKSHQTEMLYDDSPAYAGSRWALEYVLLQLASECPNDHRLRILEIAPVGSELPRQLVQCNSVGQIDYVLGHADINLCDRLRTEYKDQSFVTVAQLTEGGIGFVVDADVPEHFDLIIFRHSLNVYDNPSAALGWAKSALSAGGLLLIAERHADLSADFRGGVDRSWWHQAPDGSYQSRLLSNESWELALAAQGFHEIETFIELPGEQLSVGAYLTFAKRPDPAVHTSNEQHVANWLFLSRAGSVSHQVAQQLAKQLSFREQRVLSVSVAGTSADFLIQTVADAQNMLNAARQELGSIQHVVDLTTFGFNEFEPNGDSVLENTHCVEALNIVLAIDKGLLNEPRLWFVTTGAVLAPGLSSLTCLQPAHASLWGLGRVIMNEYPSLRCTLIDVVNELGSDFLCQLENEFLYPDGENEIALTKQGRFCLRLQRTQLKTRKVASPHEEHYRLDFHVPGQLRNLVWGPQAEKILANDEVEVRTVAAGLNFRDVMYLMGLLPDEAVENGFAGASLGLELSGVVTRVGKRVEEFAVGDAVMGFGAACFASHVVTKANALTHKPKEWTFESAATVPTAFFTVYYALKQLANVQPGERVLIHGAAGGVGIAAIQLAHHLGAEVFATAGSAEKRDFVKMLGVDHVFDSRNIAFADLILEQTAGEGVDVVLNSLAGEAIRRNLHVLKPFGRFLELGKRDFFENTPIGLRPFKDNISYFGIDVDQLLISHTELARKLFREIMALFRAGVLSPLPRRVFAANRVIDAFRYMQQAKQIGKVIVSFDNAQVAVEKTSNEQSAIRFRQDATYLVTGGLSGFGLDSASWMAAHGAGHLVLLGRRGVETPGVLDAVKEIELQGVTVKIVACDVADRASLQSVLSDIACELPPLRGVLHAAMVLDDALLGNLDPERMRKVLLPKVLGALNLHELTLSAPVDYFILYSSVATFIGNPGQGNYVAANSYLEGLATLRRGMGLPVTCTGWGPIGDTGYLTRNRTVKESLASRLGGDVLSSQMALDMLEKILLAEDRTLAVADFEWGSIARILPSAQGPRFASLRNEARDEGELADRAEDFKTLIAGKSADEIRELAKHLVTLEVSQILCIGAERINPSRSLHDLGMDSLMGVELALTLEKRFGIQLPAMMLNEGPTIERVTARIVERVTSGESNADNERGDQLALLINNVAAQHGEAMSAEEVEQTIADVRVVR